VIRWIVSSSLRFRLLVLAAAGALLAVGAARLSAMPVDVLPEFAPPYVEVQTEALGLSASEVESLVTVNLEELLNGTPWLDSIRSTSVPGLSSIVLTFKPGTNVIRARQLVSERLTLAYALPNVSSPPVILQPLSATSRAVIVGLQSRTVSPLRMSVLARWTIRPALLAVPGVANVAIWGYRDQQLQVQVDPRQLVADHVSLDQVIRTAGNAMWVSPLTYLEASVPGSGGWIDTPQQRLEVRHVFPISGPKGLAKVSVEDQTRALGNVTNVVESHQPLIGDAVLRNGPGLLLVIQKFPNANTLEVTRGVEKTFGTLQRGLAGIDVDTKVFRPASYVRSSISNLQIALLIGALLTLLILFGFLRSWRAMVICAVAIAASLAAAALVLYVRGSTMNTMVLAGFAVALAVVVDEAVVDVEGVLRRLRANREEDRTESIASTIVESSVPLRRIGLYMTLIVVLPLLPVFFMTGVSRALMSPLALTYVLAVAAAFVVASTLTPALAAILFSKGTLEAREPRVVEWLRTRYTAALERGIRAPLLVLGLVAAAVAVGVAAATTLGQELLPSFKDSNLVVQWDGPPGTSLPEMERISARVSQELRAVPGVKDVAAEIGRAVLGDRIVDVDSGQIWINVDGAADYEATLAAVKRTVDGYPGIVHRVQTYEDQSIRRVLTASGSSYPIVVRVFGPRFDQLVATSDRVAQELRGIDGVSRVDEERQIEEPQVSVTVDLAKADRHGLKPGDVRREAAALISSLVVGSLFQQQKVFQVVVWSTPKTRQSLSDVEDLLIDTPNGGHVRLGEVADVRITPTPTVIRREAVSRRVDIGVDVGGRDLGAVSSEIRRRLASVSFPLEAHAEVLGEYAEVEANRDRMIGAGIAAAIGIFLLLQALFRSWRLAVLAALGLPFALVGGVLAVFLTNDTVSLASLVGFLAVLGIAARGGILVIERFRQLEADGVRVGPDLVVRGARDRFRPILLTASMIVVALLPIVVTGSHAGLEIAHPIAVVVLGGIVTSTILNLLVVPVLYLRFGLRSKRVGQTEIRVAHVSGEGG
jgi:CzcA family heavy metal efflux pump